MKREAEMRTTQLFQLKMNPSIGWKFSAVVVLTVKIVSDTPCIENEPVLTEVEESTSV